jgi:hypothetical protein
MIFEQLYLQRGKKSKNLRCFWPLQKSNILLMLNPELLPAGFFIIQAETGNYNFPPYIAAHFIIHHVSIME